MEYLQIADWIMGVACSRELLGQTANFRPFLLENGGGDRKPDCAVMLGEAVDRPQGEPSQVARPDGREMRIWKEGDEVTAEIEYADCLCRLHAGEGWKCVRTDLEETDRHAMKKLNDVLMLAFAYSLAHGQGVLIHSSCVGLDDGRGAAFIGRSGIGKSTHSRLWLRHVEGARLINDDQPAVRVFPDGNVCIYGTPWSGKTPCYRNDKAQLKGIFCMEQAKENELVRLSPVSAFSELLKSASLMYSDLSSYRKIVQTLGTVAGSVPVYRLRNRPERAAAELSYGAIGDGR